MLKFVSLRDVDEIVRKLKSKLTGVVKEAYVFGSVVEGYAVAGESDLDLLIIPNKNIDYFSLLDAEIEELLNLGLVLHIHVADNPTYKHLIKNIKGVKII